MRGFFLPFFECKRGWRATGDLDWLGDFSFPRCGRHAIVAQSWPSAAPPVRAVQAPTKGDLRWKSKIPKPIQISSSILRFSIRKKAKKRPSNAQSLCALTRSFVRFRKAAHGWSDYEASASSCQRFCSLLHCVCDDI